MSAAVYVTVSIVKGSGFILQWSMFEAEYNWTFTKLLETAKVQVLPDWLPDLDAQPERFLSRIIEHLFSECVQVPLGFNVLECCRMNGNFVQYVYPCSSTAAQTQQNALTVLMSAAKELRFPHKNFKTAEEYKRGNGDKRLQDDIVEFLQDKQLGFVGGCENTSGKEFVRTLQNTLFTLQPHLSTLQERKAAFIPPYFVPLLQKVYNNPAAHHHKPAPLTQDRLDKLSRSLYTVLAFPWMQKPRWKQCADATCQLTMNVDMYHDYLKRTAEEQNHRHRSPTPLRFPSDGKSAHVQSIVTASCRPQALISRYKYEMLKCCML